MVRHVLTGKATSEAAQASTARWSGDMPASGKLNAQGREAFIQSFSGFLRAVDKVLLKQLIVEGPNAAAVVSYDYVNPSGGHLHQDDAEVWKVENGQIVSLTIYFDITEFRGFMG